MCFSSKSSSTKPTPPTPMSRFDYNVAQTGRTQQQQAAAANNPSTDPLNQGQLGSTDYPNNPGSL